MKNNRGISLISFILFILVIILFAFLYYEIFDIDIFGVKNEDIAAVNAVEQTDVIDMPSSQNLATNNEVTEEVSPIINSNLR